MVVRAQLVLMMCSLLPTIDASVNFITEIFRKMVDSSVT